jgi:hypothetical protein
MCLCPAEQYLDARFDVRRFIFKRIRAITAQTYTVLPHTTGSRLGHAERD